MEKEKRLVYLDIARGICILFVVFGHALIPTVRENNELIKGIYTYIYFFHMPVFFIVSGIIFENNLNKYTDNKKFLTKKFKLLIIPYIVFSCVSYIGINICFRINGFSNILKSAGYNATNLKDIIIGILFYNNHIDKHLWFVYMLFMAFVINIFTKKSKTISLVISIAIFTINHIFKINQYWNILQYDSFLVYFSIGRFLFNKKNLKKSTVIIIFIVYHILVAFNFIFNIEGILNILIRFIMGTFGTIIVIDISRRIENNNLVQKIFTTLSKYSYDIYLMHQPFIVSGIMGVLVKLGYLPIIFNIIIVTVLGIIIPIVVSKYVIRKNKMLSSICLGR